MKVKKTQTKVSKVPHLAKAIKVKRQTDHSNDESTVGKALKNAKKLLEAKKPKKSKQNGDLPKSLRPQKRSGIVQKAPRVRKTPKTRPERGIIYVGHIPHGFYEDQMKDFFKQFGIVTRVRISRSRHNGNSRGYGYVEFVEPEVAKIAAETMNNYLMCGRLLKATYIPPEKQHYGFFLGAPWSKKVYPKLLNRDRTVMLKNSLGTIKAQSKFVAKTKSKLSTLEKQLKDKGIDINLMNLVAEKS